MRLIDADALLKGKQDHTYISTHLIWNAPTVEAEPVRHGKWIWVNGWVSCSVCGCEPPSETNITSNYCPNCGAKMDLKACYCDRNKCLQMEYNGKGCAECEVTE